MRRVCEDLYYGRPQSNLHKDFINVGELPEMNNILIFRFGHLKKIVMRIMTCSI